jgi:hypothetical protein
MAKNSQLTRLVRIKLTFDLNPVDDGFKGNVQVDHHISRGRLLQGLSLKYMATCHTGAVLGRQSKSSGAKSDWDSRTLRGSGYRDGNRKE